MTYRSIPALLLAVGLSGGAGDCAVRRDASAVEPASLATSAPPARDADARSEPELPAVTLEVPRLTATGRVVRVTGAGGASALERALEDARPGDTIELEAGATFRGSFVLRARSDQSEEYVVVRTSALDMLPPSGSRVGPGDARSMARIESPSAAPALRTEAGAHRYRVVGLEVTVDPAAPLNYGIVTLGDGTSAQSSLDGVPHDLILDRCYVHGNADQEVKRGVALNSARTIVVDSYVSDCHMKGQDAQAVAGWNGPGPFKLANTYLEGSGENVLFGGADPAIEGLVPSDIEIRCNLLSKPEAWRAGDRSTWLVKNLLELKNARRVLVEGNRLENCWANGQVGFAIVLTPRNAEGRSPWSTVEDVTIRNNMVVRSANGVNLLGSDTGRESGRLSRVAVRNNLFDRIGAEAWGGGGILFQVLDGTSAVTIDHNTGLQTGSVLVGEGEAHTSFVFTNNLAPHNQYGVTGSGAGVGAPALRRYFPNCVFTNNALVGGRIGVYPPQNLFPPTLEDVGFVNLARGNYRLGKRSPLKRAGLGGTGVGCDVEALRAALCVEGDAE